MSSLKASNRQPLLPPMSLCDLLLHPCCNIFIFVPNPISIRLTMAEQLTNLDEITDTSIIKVRIVRMYSRTTRINYSKLPLELILCDENETRIEAIVKGSLRWRFSNLLKEFATLIISKFELADNNGTYKFSRHPRKILFNESTLLKRSDAFVGSPFGFHFIEFSTIMSMKKEDEYLFDVIGELIEFGDVIKFPNKGSTAQNKPEKSRLMVKLEDQSQIVLDCTLWGDYAAEMSDYIASFQGKRFIVILQFAKIVIFKGEISVSNSSYVSRLILDQENSEIVEYKKIAAEGDLVSRTISHVTSYSTTSTAQLFLPSNEMKLCSQLSSSELSSITEDSVCVALGTIVDFENREEWFYTSCMKCKKSLETDGEKYFCEKCDKQVDFPVQRYKLKIKASHDFGTASLMMFDEEVQSVVHKSVKTLREEQARDGALDSFPDVLNLLLNKTFLFCLEINAYFCRRGDKRHTIKRMTSDESLIQQFKPVYLSLLDTHSDTCDSHKLVGVVEEKSLSTPHQKRLRISVESDDENNDYQMSSTKQEITVKVEKDDV